MDAGGNKLSSSKIADQYLKNQNSYITFRTLATLAREVALTITEELNKSNKMFKSLLTIILVLPVLIFFRELIVVANFVACLFVPLQVTSSSSGVFTQITIE